MTRLAFICSPYRNLTREQALDTARKTAQVALERGLMPVSPILNFDGVLREDTEQQRKEVLTQCQRLLSRCDCVVVYADTISSGMKSEIDYATQHNMPVHYITKDKLPQ